MLFAFANVCAYVYLRPALPDVGSLRDVQLQVPLRVYTRDGRLIAAIGDQRRIPMRYDQLPKKLIQAFLATEDDRFFQHHGVDWQGILRAAVANLKAGGIRQGASTITMQVSRDMFLTPRRDMKRKMSEIYISLLMETEFTKEEIFSLYVNKIFLGQRAYGVGAAAEVYFGKTLDQLNIAEMATLAGIPTAPSVVNPVANTTQRIPLRWSHACTVPPSKWMPRTWGKWSAMRCRPNTATASTPQASGCTRPSIRAWRMPRP
jgi:penicillin-binding protein 1A